MLPAIPRSGAKPSGSSTPESLTPSSSPAKASTIFSKTVPEGKYEKGSNLKAKNISPSSSGSSPKASGEVLARSDEASSLSSVHSPDEICEELYNTPPEQMTFIIQGILIRMACQQLKKTTLSKLTKEEDIKKEMSPLIEKTLEDFLANSSYGCTLLNALHEQLTQLDPKQEYAKALASVIDHWTIALFSNQPTERLRIYNLRLLITQFEEKKSKKLEKEQIPDPLEKFISHSNRLYQLLDEFEDVMSFFVLKQLEHPLTSCGYVYSFGKNFIEKRFPIKLQSKALFINPDQITRSLVPSGVVVASRIVIENYNLLKEYPKVSMLRVEEKSFLRNLLKTLLEKLQPDQYKKASEILDSTLDRYLKAAGKEYTPDEKVLFEASVKKFKKSLEGTKDEIESKSKAQAEQVILAKRLETVYRSLPIFKILHLLCVNNIAPGVQIQLQLFKPVVPPFYLIQDQDHGTPIYIEWDEKQEFVEIKQFRKLDIFWQEGEKLSTIRETSTPVGSFLVCYSYSEKLNSDKLDEDIPGFFQVNSLTLNPETPKDQVVDLFRLGLKIASIGKMLK